MGNIIFWWIAFIVIFIGVYFIDRVVTDHRKGEISVKTSLRWTGVWISIALLFGWAIYLFFPQNEGVEINTAHEMGMKFIAGYLTEYSLSVDNLFVFIMIFSMMGIASHNQPKLLKMGILISIVLRILFILVGMSLVQRFEWVIYIFGIVLVWTAYKMLYSNEEDQVDPESNMLYKGASAVFPVFPDKHSSQFFVKESGKCFVTVTFLCLLVIGSTDVLFAVDSIPAIIGVIAEGEHGILSAGEENFLAVSSNVFAVMGLTSLFFALKGIVGMFRFLKHGVCFILFFIGIKMLLGFFHPVAEFFHEYSWVSLTVIILTLAFSIILSRLISDKKKMIECVPNFSEGRDMTIIDRIVDEIKSVDGVQVIDIDPGKAANRTVVTFVGKPEPVCEAAFRAVKKAAELIDMSKQKGEHPRFGATDVLPLIPVSNITMKETVAYAHKLGQRIGKELGIPIYFYEFAASEEKRRNLAHCRAGEYEGLPQKLVHPEWKPDCGPAELTKTVRRSGAIALSARNFLIAYNVNLNTTSTRLANSIAFDIREKGRVKREGNLLTGQIVRDENGEPVYTPGLLKGVKGIGWYIEEYGIAQLSFNITDITTVPMHQVFELACERAAMRGIRVTGSELVGLVPLNTLLDAGNYFLRKQHQSTSISEEEILNTAVKSLGLDELAPFDPKKKIIEYLIEDH